MSSYGSWSVKGIDDRARAIAKEKARLEGVTLGDYINNLLLEGHSEAGPRDHDLGFYEDRAPLHRTPQHHAPPAFRHEPAHRPEPMGSPGALDNLTRRIEAVEARSTLAITGMDQTVLGLLARLERTETTSTAIAADIDRTMDELRETHEALQAKVREIEANDTTHESLQAMKALETALGKLASHVYEENAHTQDETTAIKGRMETGFNDLAERVEGMEVKVEQTLAKAAQRVEKAVEQSELRAEGTSRHLSERFTAIETSVASKLAKVDEMDQRMGAVQSDVSGALTSMEGTLVRIQDRLNRAENTTDAALKALEHTFASLDERIETVAQQVNPEQAAMVRAQLEQKFETLAADLRASVDQTRAQLADEIQQAAAGTNPELFGRLGETVETLKVRLAAGEDQIHQITSGLDARLSRVENSEGAGGVEQLSEQVTALADQLNERVSESEQRSAAAIEQVGEQVATAISRVQARQDAAVAGFEKSLETANAKHETRLSKALANISDRLADMQTQTVSVMSPVQRAMASLAQRLEALEDLSAPPHAQLESAFDGADDPVMETGLTPEPEPIDLGPDPETELEDQAPLHDLAAATELTDETVGEDDFIAGLPSLDESTPDELAQPGSGDDMFAADTHDEADEDYARSDSEADPFTARPDDDMADVFAEFEPAEETWDHGRDEARDSDIFAEDPFLDSNDEDALVRLGEEIASDDGDDLIEDEDAYEDDAYEGRDRFADLEAAEEEAEEDDPADYLARARRAAISAASSKESNEVTRQSRRSAASGGAAMPSAKKPASKLPMIAAASALALTAAGAGGYVYLRGKQAKTTQIASAVPVLPPAPVTGNDGDSPTLAGISYDEAAEALSEQALEADLFEEEGSSAPNTVEPVLAAESAAGPEITRVPLPQIPAALTLEQAALQGDGVAEYLWGEARLAANDYAQGPTFIRRAAQQGLPAAQYRLAKLHEKGLGVPRDLASARTWTERAAKGGNVSAMHDLAVFYADGEGGPQSYAAAAEWFRKAADFGLVDSQYNLAVLYENGLGISPSKTEALYWYEIAARNGDASAPANVGQLRAALDLEAAQGAQRRAATWNASPLPAAANGDFGIQAWQNGSREQVAVLQQVLNGLGFEAGAPDGLVGAGTRQAIRDFQASANLPVDGLVTDRLIEALNQKAASAA